MLPKHETASAKVNLDPNSLTNLEGLRIKEIENQTRATSVVEDSRQTIELFRKLASSHLSPEEVKQVQSDRQLTISSKKKRIITGKLIFKD